MPAACPLISACSTPVQFTSMETVIHTAWSAARECVRTSHQTLPEGYTFLTTGILMCWLVVVPFSLPEGRLVQLAYATVAGQLNSFTIVHVFATAAEQLHILHVFATDPEGGLKVR